MPDVTVDFCCCCQTNTLACFAWQWPLQCTNILCMFVCLTII